ncbi:hypothetical protein [Alicyclobacillus dauci]|uniref:Uncharacterized protein n=1 Tax=Alicyclobacillus dauci TaxID=1475485 RepID=A0ABY6Z2Y8_9BACL|nr:hypothetical protein [Alicyclobacillus dauci]WAH37119.1 hypothetical protein NZD86_00630 [Alicyclobacillus dauci]
MKLTPEHVLTSIGLTLAATMVVPIAKRMKEPGLHRGRIAASLVGIEMRKRLAYVSEEIEDFVAEVQYERRRIQQNRNGAT